jgi:hypothetical protein
MGEGQEGQGDKGQGDRGQGDRFVVPVLFTYPISERSDENWGYCKCPLVPYRIVCYFNIHNRTYFRINVCIFTNGYLPSTQDGWVPCFSRKIGKNFGHGTVPLSLRKVKICKSFYFLIENKKRT